MTPYQRCPYCEVVVEIDTDGKDALKRHIRVEHASEDRSRKSHRAT